MMPANERVEHIRTLLAEALAPALLEVGDDSHLHAGHAGAASGGGHYSVKIVSERFEGLRLVMRHRLVYDAVQAMMHSDIHALAITAIAPSEAQTDTVDRFSKT
jgi:BolA protein